MQLVVRGQQPLRLMGISDRICQRCSVGASLSLHISALQGCAKFRAPLLMFLQVHQSGCHVLLPSTAERIYPEAFPMVHEQQRSRTCYIWSGSSYSHLPSLPGTVRIRTPRCTTTRTHLWKRGAFQKMSERGYKYDHCGAMRLQSVSQRDLRVGSHSGWGTERRHSFKSKRGRTVA